MHSSQHYEIDILCSKKVWTYGRFVKKPFIYMTSVMKVGISNMLFYPTIGSKYFVKTQTYVALFGPHELSLIFSGGMCLELTSLYPITSLDNGKMTCFQVSLKIS